MGEDLFLSAHPCPDGNWGLALGSAINAVFLVGYQHFSTHYSHFLSIGIIPHSD
jgi:hypothetical protein